MEDSDNAVTVGQLVDRLAELDPALPVQMDWQGMDNLRHDWATDLDVLVRVEEDRVHIGL